MVKRTRAVLAGAILISVAVVGWAAPAGAQQVVDAGREGDGSGGFAFVLFAAMVFLITGAMFFMDRVRRRAGDQDVPTP